jgi:hypothetical protein
MGDNARAWPLVVAVTTIMLALSFAGCVDDDGDDDGNGDEVDWEHLTINLSSPSVGARDNVWDANISVNKVTPNGTRVPWAELSITIKDGTSGSVLLGPVTPLPWAGTYGSEVEVWYVDMAGDATILEAGDYIYITGMDDTYEGAHITLEGGGHVLASTVLTTDFP